MLQRAKYTNWFRDLVIETGPMMNGGAPATMREAIIEIVATIGAIDTLVYDHTEVEHDNPDGTTTYSVIDLSDHARDELARQARDATSCPAPEATVAMPQKADRHGVRRGKAA